MKKTIILAGLILLGAPGAFAQERRLSCEETRDRALTRVTIVSNSRVLMEEDLAALSVTLRHARRGIAGLKRELAGLRKELQEAQAASSETKDAEPEPEATEPETEGPDPETKAPAGETTKELNQ